MEIFNNMVCTVAENNINIKDSYTMTKESDMKDTLYAIQQKHPECNTFKRTYDSLLNEWKSHNKLYSWEMFKSHTKDVDLDYPAKWYTEILYWLLSR